MFKGFFVILSHHLIEGLRSQKKWQLFLCPFLKVKINSGLIPNLNAKLISYNKSNEKIEIKRKRVATTFLINQCSKADSPHFVYLHEQTFFKNIFTSWHRLKNHVGFSTKNATSCGKRKKEISFDIKVRTKISKKLA